MGCFGHEIWCRAVFRRLHLQRLYEQGLLNSLRAWGLSACRSGTGCQRVSGRGHAPCSDERCLSAVRASVSWTDYAAAASGLDSAPTSRTLPASGLSTGACSTSVWSGFHRRHRVPSHRRRGGACLHPAKTVADCFKYRNKIGQEVALEALRDCWQKRAATMDELWKYARICRVANVMRPYLESIAI